MSRRSSLLAASLLAASLLTTGLAGPALADPPASASEDEPSRPGWLTPQFLTDVGAKLAVPLIGLPLTLGFWPQTVPLLVLAPLTLSAGHLYAGDPARGLLYGLGGYAAMGIPFGLTMAVASALNPPSGHGFQVFANLGVANLVGAACLVSYGEYGARDADETERRVVQARQLDRLSGGGRSRVVPPARNALGASFGAVAGSGLTYARDLGSGFGLRVAGLGWTNEGRTFWNLGGALTRDVVSAPFGGLTATLYGVLGVDARGMAFAGGSGLSAGAAMQLRGTAGLGLAYGPVFLEGGPSAYHAGSVGFGPAFGTGLVWRF